MARPPGDTTARRTAQRPARGIAQPRLRRLPRAGRLRAKNTVQQGDRTWILRLLPSSWKASPSASPSASSSPARASSPTAAGRGPRPVRRTRPPRWSHRRRHSSPKPAPGPSVPPLPVPSFGASHVPLPSRTRTERGNRDTAGPRLSRTAHPCDGVGRSRVSSGRGARTRRSPPGHHPRPCTVPPEKRPPRSGRRCRRIPDQRRPEGYATPVHRPITSLVRSTTWVQPLDRAA